MNQSLNDKISSDKQNSKKKQINQKAGQILLYLPVVGGLLFVGGSVLYWPTFDKIGYQTTGAISFLVGSSVFFICDVIGGVVEPQFNPLSPLKNIGCLKSLLTAMSNISFIVGSVYYIPLLNGLQTGSNIFIVASLLLIIPQLLAIWGIFTCINYTASFYFQFFEYRKAIYLMNALTSIGCIFLIIGTILFKNDEYCPNKLYFKQAVIMFIIGSFFFFINAISSIRMKKKRLEDPLHQHHQSIKKLYIKN